jgi:hypothetical protein
MWILEKDTYDVLVGNSSANTPLKACFDVEARGGGRDCNLILITMLTRKLSCPLANCMTQVSWISGINSHIFIR